MSGSQNSPPSCVLDSSSIDDSWAPCLFSPISIDDDFSWDTYVPALSHVEDSETDDLLLSSDRVPVEQQPRMRRSFDLNKIASNVGPLMRHLAFSNNVNPPPVAKEFHNNVLNGGEGLASSRGWTSPWTITGHNQTSCKVSENNFDFTISCNNGGTPHTTTPKSKGMNYSWSSETNFISFSSSPVLGHNEDVVTHLSSLEYSQVVGGGKHLEKITSPGKIRSKKGGRVSHPRSNVIVGRKARKQERAIQN